MEHRKKFLTTCVSSTIFIGLLFLATPFWKSWLPNAKSSGVVEVNLSKIPLGTAKTFELAGYPIMVYRPDKKSKEYLVSLNQKTNGPEYTLKNIPNFFIYFPISTHRGCLLQEVKQPDRLSYGYTGLVDPCHRGFWDYAGRLIPSAHAGEGLKNLGLFTNYKQLSENVLLLGY